MAQKKENEELKAEQEAGRALVKELGERCERDARLVYQLQREVAVFKGRCGVNAMMNAKLMGLMSQVCDDPPGCTTAP